MKRKSLRGLLSLVGILGALVACDIEAPSSLTVKQGTSSAPGVISGQVINGTTQLPQENLTVEIASGTLKTTKTDKNGRFSISGLAVTTLCDNTSNGTMCFDVSDWHHVRITDQRSVGSGSSRIPSEADRLAPLNMRAAIVQAGNTGGANPLAENDMDVLRMNPGVAVNALLTVPGGTPAPAGVTVAAYWDSQGDCTSEQNSNGSEWSYMESFDLVPASVTTDASGIAAFSGLDRCQEYELIVPAQVVGGTPMVSTSLSLTDLPEGTPNKVITLDPAVPDESISIIVTNMDLESNSPYVRSGGSLPNFSDTWVAYGAVLNTTTSNITTTDYTAPITGNLILVTRVPATLDGDIGLFYEDTLADPDADNDGAADAGWPADKTVAGVTGSFDSFGSILTVVHTEDLKKNQFYQLTGTLRNNANNSFFNLATGVDEIYVSDSGSVPSATTITVDNLDGEQPALTTGTPYLVFAEAVAGTYRVISYTDDGTTTVVNGSNQTINQGTLIRFASHTGDGTPTCDSCLSTAAPFTADEDKVIDSIAGVPALNDDGGNDSVEIFLDVVDMQGNRFVGTTTFAVR